jgi:hypothetical protein
MDRDAIRFEHNSHPCKLKVANLAAFKKFLYEKEKARRTQRLLDPFRVEKNFGSRGISIYRTMESRRCLHAVESTAGKRFTTSSSLGASTLPSCRPR